MLIALEDRFAHQMSVRFDGSLERAAAFVPPSLWPYFLHPIEGQGFVPPAGHLDDPKLPVRVNHGVWQTCCPFCPSAQHASREDHRFFCARCLNAAVGFKTLPVVWPKHADEIERLLGARPFVPTRNWETDETVEHLAAENALNGWAT